MTDPRPIAQKVYIFLFFVLLLVTQTALAQWTWERNPEGAFIKSLHPYNNTMFAGTSGGGIYHTSNDGQSWDYLSVSSDGVDYFGVARNSLFYIEANTGLHRITNSEIKSINSIPAQRLWTHDSLIFVAIPNNRYFLSYNDGENWSEIFKFKGRYVNSISFSEDKIFAAINDSIYHSSDLHTWNGIKSAIQVFRMQISGDSAWVFRDKLYKSDLNFTVAREIEIPPVEWIWDLELLGDSVFMATEEGIFYSADNGEQWIQVDTEERLANTNSFSVISFLNDKLYAGSYDGLYLTTLDDLYLTRSQQGLSNVSLDEIYVDGDELILSAANPSRAYQSTDGGTTWQTTYATGGWTGDIETIGHLKLLAYGRGVKVLGEAGGDWYLDHYSLYDTAVYSLAIHNDTLYAASTKGLFLSTDTARTWTSLNANIPATDLRDVLVNDTAIFAATNGSNVLWSSDRGATWVSLAQENFPMHVEKLILYNGKLVAGCGCEKSAFAYNFSSQSWEDISNGLDYVPISDFVVHDNHLIGASWTRGVYQYNPHANTWNDIGDGLPAGVRALGIGFGKLWAASWTHGVSTLSLAYFNAVVAPTTLEVTNITDSSATVTWGAVANAASYRVSVSDNNFATVLPDYDHAFVKENLINLTGLEKTTTYQIKIEAENFGDTSVFSSTAEFITLDAIPVPPSHVVVTQVSVDGVNIAWSDNSDNETSFIIERGRKGINGFFQIGTVDTNVTQFTNGGHEQGQQYYYRVKAVNAIGSSGFSATSDTITIITPTTAPANLTAVARSLSVVQLEWAHNSDDETGFVIERSNDGENFEEVGVTEANNTVFLDSGLLQQEYTYRVAAQNAAGLSAYSNSVAVTLDIELPAAPTSLAVTFPSGNLQLTWQDEASNEDGYIIERSVETNTSFIILDSVAANSTSFVDEEYNPSLSYFYRVSAFNLAGTASASADGFFVTEISESLQSGLVLYPNPADKYISVESEEFKNGQFQVYEAKGQLLMDKKISGNNTIDISQLPLGIYYVRIVTRTMVAHSRLLINR